MADMRLPDILDWLKIQEGWYSNDPEDKGGETAWGISNAIRLAAIGRGLIPNTSSKDLSWAQAQLIYKVMFWDRVDCGSIPAPYCWWVFDTEVNQGVQGVRFLQRSVGATADGVFGPDTLIACQAANPVLALIRFQTLRLESYRLDLKADRYFRGWANRCGSLMAFSLKYVYTEKEK